LRQLLQAQGFIVASVEELQGILKRGRQAAIFGQSDRFLGNQRGAAHQKGEEGAKQPLAGNFVGMGVRLLPSPSLKKVGQASVSDGEGRALVMGGQSQLRPHSDDAKRMDLKPKPVAQSRLFPDPHIRDAVDTFWQERPMSFGQRKPSAVDQHLGLSR
jgi:hypothetical protein